MATTETKIKKPKVAKTAAPKAAKIAKAVKAPKPAKASAKKEKVATDGKVVLRIRVRAYESKIWTLLLNKSWIQPHVMTQIL